jgi:hypothetical protein
LYAVRRLVVAFVQWSYIPVRRLPTFTLPPSKHWSQLLIAKEELELQLTVLYSPSEDPASGVTVGAALSTGGASVDTVVGVGVVTVAGSAANAYAAEEIAIIAILVITRDLIGEKRWENKYTWT